MKKKLLAISLATIAIGASAATPMWLRDVKISPDGTQPGSDVALPPEFGILLQCRKKCLTGKLRRQIFLPAQSQQVQLHIPEVLPIDLLKFRHTLTSFIH